MNSPPKKVVERMKQAIPRFQKILEDAKKRDVNESDTVTIIVDMLSAIFGYDKYSEITSETCIRGEFCDLAIVVEGKTRFLIEVKAIGLDLKSNHLRQAINYGSREGIQWVILTNGMCWQAHSIKFEQPISHELVFDFHVPTISTRTAEDLNTLFLICRESLSKAKMAIEEFHEYSQIINRYTIAALLQSETVAKVIKKELRSLSPKSKVSLEGVGALITETLKRDVVEGDSAADATKLLKKFTRKRLRQLEKNEVCTNNVSTEGAQVT